ncbi:hypothetical protein KY336_01420 [Candidatus Woesearchaeota archaeon]|nr:hypothetical protein [Candidatus Woesearchaeota archaeon]
MASVLGMGILIMAVTTVAYIVVISLIMWWLSKLLKFKNNGFKPAITVAGIAGIISFVLGLILVFIPMAALAVVLNIVFALIVVLVHLFLIRYLYKESWGKTFLLWVLVMIAYIVLGAIIGLVLGMITKVKIPYLTAKLI